MLRPFQQDHCEILMLKNPYDKFCLIVVKLEVHYISMLPQLNEINKGMRMGS